jgi:hypothetical protein
VFGFDDIDTDWSHYPRTTDSGIFHDVFTSRIGRSPAMQEVSRLASISSNCSPPLLHRLHLHRLQGLTGCWPGLAQGGSHCVSLASGGWCDSARLKMASAGMCFDDHPAASAHDARDKESIMRLSKQRAAERYGESFACTVYVGDGVWDALARRSVGIPFIGIGTGSRATRVSAEGAVCVFPDFSDADVFLRSLYEITNAA